MKDHNPTGSFPTPGFTTGSYARPGGPRGGARKQSKGKGYLFFLFALVFAAGAGYLVFQTLKDASAGQKPLPTAPVVVAAQDISLGTTLTAEHLKVIPWPAENAPAAHFERPEDLVGRVAKVDLFQNEMIHDVRLAPIEAGNGLGALIPSGMRAHAVKVTDESGVAGFIHPGDFVDVVMILRLQGGELEARTTLQNIKVIAINDQYQSSDETRGKAMKATVVTLLVTPPQAEQLALATTNGQIVLTLRNGYDSEEVASTGFSPTKIVDASKPEQNGDVVDTGTKTFAEAVAKKDEDKKKKDPKKGEPAKPAEPETTKPAEPETPKLPQIIKGDKVKNK